MTPRERRFLRWGSALALAGTAVMRGGPMLAAMASERALTWRSQKNWLILARSEIARLPGLEDSAAVLKRRIVALAPALLAADDSIEAGRELSALLMEMAGRQDMKMVQVDAKPDSVKSGSLGRATAALTVECDVKGLAGLLTAVERTPIVLVPQSLTVDAPDPRSAESSPELLRVTLTVSGWFLHRVERR